MTYLRSVCGLAAELTAKTVPMAGLLVALAGPAVAQTERVVAAAQAESCPGDNGAITVSVSQSQAQGGRYGRR